MNCRNFEEEIRQLQRCGCEQCYRKYRMLMERLEREYYDYRPKIPYCPPDLIIKQNAVLATAIDFVKEKPVEEKPITNTAVKLLVDKLKVCQSELQLQQTNIDMYKRYLKDWNSKKQISQKQIKDLSVALKKLGHKE